MCKLDEILARRDEVNALARKNRAGRKFVFDSLFSNPAFAARRIKTLVCFVAVFEALISWAWTPDEEERTETIDGATWSYFVSNGVATITGVATERTELAIPAQFGTTPVVAIDDWAFNASYHHGGYDPIRPLGDATISLTIPVSVENIGRAAFTGMTSLVEFAVEDGSLFLKTIDGVLFDISGETLIAYPSARGGSSYDIPGSVVRIEQFAFESSKLEHVVFPHGVESIGEDAFAFCQDLVEMTLPESLLRIDKCAFEGCSSLQTVRFPSMLASEDDPDWFWGCTSLVSITVAEGNASMKDIDGVLYDKSGKSLFVVPPGRKGTLTVSAGVEKIGYEAFQSCRFLTAVLFPDGLKEIQTSFFDATSPLSMVVPESVTNLSFGWTAEVPKRLVVPDSLSEKLLSFGDNEWERPVPEGCRIVPRSDLAGRTTSNGVPYEWFYNYGSLLDATENDNCENASLVSASNGRPAWECYVAGLDPTDPDDDLVAAIEIKDGVPVVGVGGKGKRPGRTYVVEGKEKLSDQWGPTNAASRFFHVKTSLEGD